MESETTNKSFILLFVGYIPVFLYLLPNLVLGENSFIYIHDMWDSNFIWWKILVENNQVFISNKEIVPNMMNGLPRSSYPTPFNFYLLLELIFPTFTAYVINLFIIHSTAYFGMYFLLKSHFSQKKNEWIIIGVALSFSLLVFWPPGRLSVAGQPLALYSFLKFRYKKQKWFDWFFISLLPFNSSFQLAFVFFIATIALLFINDVVKKKEINWVFFFSILVMSLLFIFVEFRLIQNMFLNQDYISHRESFSKPTFSFWESCQRALELFIFSKYHAHSYQYYAIGLTTALFMIVLFIKVIIFIKNKKKPYFQKQEKLVLGFMLILILIAINYGLYSYKGFSSVKNAIPLLEKFNFTRFYFLFPLIWHLIFFIELEYFIDFFSQIHYHTFSFPKIGLSLSKRKTLQTLFISFLFLFQITELFLHNINLNPNIQPPPIGDEIYRYNEFFASSQFSNIKDDIGKAQSSYRIACIGFHPSVALYNGFYTIDGYISNYPLEYKIQFRTLIENELAKNAEIQVTYDNIGSRCYLYTAELGKDFLCTKFENKSIHNLELNVTALYSLNCEFIFSAVPILNYLDNNITLFGTYQSTKSIWKISVYEVI